MAKQKKAYPLDLKTMFGVTTMGFLQTIANSLMTTMLMLYITDYSGMYQGIAGKAAAAATLLLLVGRIWDAVNDPLLGFIMDKSPRTKWGKFKPYMFGGTLLSAVFIILMFNIPNGFSDFGKVAWLYVLYIIFETAFTLMPMIPLTISLSDDANVRTKLLVSPRIGNMLIAIPMSFFLAIASAIGGGMPNIGLTVVLFIVPTLAISLLGIACIKEGRANVKETEITLKDIVAIFRENPAMRYSLLGSVMGGFVFPFITAASTYYIKYAFGPENLGTYSGIFGICMLLSIIAGTFVASAVQKRTTPAENNIICFLVTVIPLAILWVISFAGPIRNVGLFFGLLSIALLGSGMGFIPSSLINMEVMDYNKFKLGKSMEGVTNSIGTFVQKLQSAVSSTATGLVLIAVGYNAELYENAVNIPESLFSGLSLVFFALPALFALLTCGVYWFYPLRKKSDRDAVYAKLEAMR